MTPSVKTFFLATRPQFLLLSLILVLLGSAIAYHQGSANLAYALLCGLGLLLLHISTNVLNDYFDFKSGIDQKTQPTPFSGGSGSIVHNRISSRQAFWFGLGAFLLAVPVGAYFLLVRGPVLLPFFVLGSIFVLLGTSHLTRVGFAVGELAAGLGLGSLPVLGTFLIIQGKIDAAAVYACVPSGILVLNLLFLNEFPDVDADRAGGRKTLPIILGMRGAAWLYAALVSLVYGWIIAGAILRIMPWFCLASLLTLPLGIKAVRGGFNHAQRELLVAGQGANVGMILGIQFLLAIGYFAAAMVKS